MSLLFSQVANAAPNETALLVIGVAACIGALVMLLWKRDAKTTA